ncbi:hypothetical protein GWL_09670 [Herbaspirillum sp. GW103]|nr:hypothetical protein GWL_09670 [Herbaspirillum sp. GW103]
MRSKTWSFLIVIWNAAGPEAEETMPPEPAASWSHGQSV